MKTVLEYFNDICQIPRESGNETGIKNFLLSWAKENGLQALSDDAGNVTMRNSDNPKVTLQGHQDMVCVKTADSTHDFLKDPIETYIDGDWLKAKGTTLGGDDGIAIAMAMTLFTDPQTKDIPFEAVFTKSEETGMFGALGIDPKMIKSHKLLNLDSEGEGTIIIGCAGGTTVSASKELNYEPFSNSFKTIELTVSGLPGGHSGSEIHLDRPNAIKELCKKIETFGDFRIVSFNGGTRDNVIPSEAKAVICVPAGADTAEFVTCNNPQKVVSKKDSRDIVKVLLECPHGVKSWSKTVKDVVETSDNLAKADISEGKLNVTISIRSLVGEEKEKFAESVSALLIEYGFETKICGKYPAWTPNADSSLAKECAAAWKEVTGKDAFITSIHAGLECGIIGDRIPGLDCVSMGPEVQEIHSVNERLSIKSTERVLNFLKSLLKSLN